MDRRDITMTNDRFCLLSFMDNICCLLTDYNVWGPIQDELDEWCGNNNCKREGMIVTFKDMDAFLIFKMKWG